MAARTSGGVRVVSLVPSSTETLLALGASVVGCTKYCEQPGIAQVGGTKNPDIDAIVGLRPDVVVVDREENRVEDHDALIAAGLEVFVSHVADLASGLAVIGDLALVAGRDVPTKLAEAVAGIRARSGHVSTEARLTAFVPIWRRPWMAIGSATYGADLLRHLGIDVVVPTISDGAAASPYPTVELDEVHRLRPDFVLVPSEPYAFSSAHLAELGDALPDSSVIPVDGQDLFWWGSRTPDALSRLSEELVLPPPA